MSDSVTQPPDKPDLTKYVDGDPELDRLTEQLFSDALDRACDARIASRARRETQDPVEIYRRSQELRVQDEIGRERARRDARRQLDREERGQQRMPDILTLRERLARPIPDTQWRIEGIQPAGSRVVLAAQFKAGKTTLTGDLIRSLADGDDFLGRFKVAPANGPIVLIDTEMGEAKDLDLAFSATEVLDHASVNYELAEALEGCGVRTAPQLGALFRDLRDREIGGLRLVRCRRENGVLSVERCTCATCKCRRSENGRMDRLSDLTERVYADAKTLDCARYLACIVTTRSQYEAVEEFKRRHPLSVHLKSIERSILTKDAAPGTPTGGSPSWGEALVPASELAPAMIQFSAPSGIVDRLDAPHVPFNTSVPRDLSASGEAEFFRGPGLLKAAVEGSFDTTSLPILTVAAIAVFTRELVRLTSTAAVTLTRGIIARALARGLDTVFLSTDAAVADTSPAGILNGVTPISTTGDPAADLKDLIQEFVSAGGSLENAALVMSSENAIGARLTSSQLFENLRRDGGTVAGLPTVAGASAGSKVILIDLTKIIIADDRQFRAEVSTQTTITMSEGVTVNLFQKNLAALKLERAVNWSATDGAAAFISDANYLSIGSPA